MQKILSALVDGLADVRPLRKERKQTVDRRTNIARAIVAGLRTLARGKLGERCKLIAVELSSGILTSNIIGIVDGNWLRVDINPHKGRYQRNLVLKELNFFGAGKDSAKGSNVRRCEITKAFPRELLLSQPNRLFREGRNRYPRRAAGGHLRKGPQRCIKIDRPLHFIKKIGLASIAVDDGNQNGAGILKELKLVAKNHLLALNDLRDLGAAVVFALDQQATGAHNLQVHRVLQKGTFHERYGQTLADRLRDWCGKQRRSTAAPPGRPQGEPKAAKANEKGPETETAFAFALTFACPPNNAVPNLAVTGLKRGRHGG